MITLKDITILIPSIGRSSVINSIRSVPEECECIAFISGEDYDLDLKNAEPTRVIRDSKLNGPGQAKHFLISKCSTKYFMLLDDDDRVTKEYLERAVELLNKGYEWVNSAYDQFGDSLDYSIVERPEDLLKYLFEYEKYSDNYSRSHLYPNSEIIMSTENYTKLHRYFHLSYGDDIIPVVSHMLTHRGVFMMEMAIPRDATSNSVSRSFIPDYKSKPIISELGELISNSSTYLESCIWARCLDNTIKRIDYINSRVNG